MEILTALVFILGLVSAFGSECTDVSGTWENELGSLVRLELKEDNRLTGKYWTAVEASEGASTLTTNITGIFSYRRKEALLAFAVLFNHGASLTSWVGQCLVCDDKEILYMTYVLRQYITDPKKKWTSLIINQNTFWRTEKEIPADSSSPEVSSSVSHSTDSGNSLGSRNIGGMWKSDNEEINFTEMNETVPGKEIYISGKWKRNTSEEMQLYGMIDKVQKEKYYLSDVQGTKDDTKVLAVALVGKINERVRGWTGHISSEHSNVPEILETSWLEHEFSPSCSEPRMNVLFRMGNYTEMTSDPEYILKEPETFLEKIRRFFTSMF